MALEWLKGILGDKYTEDIDKQVSAEIGKVAELANWYLSWLDAPEMRAIPAPPVWLDKL